MMKNYIRDNRILIIVTCLLIAGVCAAGIFLDSNVWAQPEITEEVAEEAPEEIVISKSSVPMDNDLLHKELKQEKLYLKSLEALAAVPGEEETETPAEPLPAGEASGFVTVGLYSSCSSVSGT